MQSVIPSRSRLSTWFLLPQPRLEEDQPGALAPVSSTGSPGGTASPACCPGGSAGCCPSLHCWVSTASSAPADQQLGACWCSQSASAISCQLWGKGSSRMALAGERALAAPAVLGSPAVEAQRSQQSTGMERNGLSLPLPVTDTISLFSSPRQMQADEGFAL